MPRHSPLFARTLILRAAVVGLLILTPTAAQASLSWSGDFDGGDLTQYDSTGVYEVAADRVTLVTNPARSGFAARFEVRPGDNYGGWSGERAQVRKTGLVSGRNEGEGDESWWGWSLYLPPDFQDTSSFWQIFLEWHHTGLTGSPPVTFHVIKGRFVVRIVKSADPTQGNSWTEFDLGPATRGAWTDFVYHAKWSTDPARAVNEVWVNGTRVQSITGHPNLFNGHTNYLLIGWYRDRASITQVVYIDNVRRGTAYEDVAGSGSGSGSGSSSGSGSGGSNTGSTSVSEPTARTVAPADGSTVGDNVVWEADATNATRVEFLIDGTMRWTENQAPYRFNGDTATLDTRTLSNGTHSLEVRAVASDGKVATSKVTVNVDNKSDSVVAPTVTTVSPADGSTVSGGVVWEAHATNATRVEFLIDGTLRWTENHAPYRFNGDTATLDTRTLSNGEHVLEVRAVASDGRAATSRRTVTVDNRRKPRREGRQLSSSGRVAPQFVDDVSVRATSRGRLNVAASSLPYSRVTVVARAASGSILGVTRTRADAHGRIAARVNMARWNGHQQVVVTVGALKNNDLRRSRVAVRFDARQLRMLA